MDDIRLSNNETLPVFARLSFWRRPNAPHLAPLLRRLIFGFGSALLVGASGPAQADIYFYEDANGVLHFTDAPDTPEFNLVLKDPTAQAAAPSPFSPELKPSTELRLWLPAIDAAAKRNQVPVALLAALVETESAFRSNAVSRKGAQGLTQLMPMTARELGVRNAFDPMHNLDGGARYLRMMLDRFNGDVRLALAAYNAGPAAVEKYGNAVPPFAETLAYVARVQARARSNEARGLQ